MTRKSMTYGPNCQDSDTLVLTPPTKRGKVRCGCCGRFVDIYADPTDPNKARRLRRHDA